MDKIRKNLLEPKLRPLFVSVAVCAIIIILPHLIYWNRAYPGVKVAGSDISGKTLSQAEKITNSLPKSDKIILSFEGKKYEYAASSELGLEYQTNKTAARALKVGRKGSLGKTTRDKWKALTRGINIPLSILLDSDSLDLVIEQVSQDLNIPSVDPGVNIQDKQVVVSAGKAGQEVKKEDLRTNIYQALAFIETEEIIIPIEKTNPALSPEEVKIIEVRATKLLGKQVQITFERESFTYRDSDLVTILGSSQSFLDIEKAGTLVSDLSEGINRKPQDARFEFADGKVKEFTPAKDGIRVREDETIKQLAGALKELVETEEKTAIFQLSVEATRPETQNQDVNNLGINELIGRGESIYRGSIPGRIHNLSLAASRLNGILIKPQEEFSFNKAVGDISLSTGYQQAYVIKEGKTILDDGGGVCQTSTTFFRAALNTGLPIIERHQHSYRVSYYENGSKPGYDAAIYLPNIDLRIKNDTPAHILIQIKNDRQNAKLVFEFYGTSDGRKAETLNYRQWDARPAPPDLYQDDPTLPVGTTKQVERAVPGLKTAFDYKVTRNGETVFEKTFTSNFRPWQAVYLRGTAPTQ